MHYTNVHTHTHTKIFSEFSRLDELSSEFDDDINEWNMP